MFKTYDVYSLILMVSFVSFIGFIVENIWLALTKGYINNRNMNAPFLLGDGLFILCLYLYVGTPNESRLFGQTELSLSIVVKYLIYFAICFFAVSIGEIILGTLVEKICGFEYWNYTWLPFHVTKYTSLFTSMGFACGITFFMGSCFEPLMRMLSAMDYKKAKFIGCILLFIMVCDFVLSFYKMYKGRTFYVVWQKELKHNAKINFRFKKAK